MVCRRNYLRSTADTVCGYARGVQMKQNRVINIALLMINVILIAVCAVMYLRADRIAPEFEFQAADVIYRREMNTAELLAGITAYDRADGDVTDRIVIEKITENQKDSTAVVFYAVSDRSGNVAKTSKLFQAVFDKGAESFMEAGISAELNRDLTGSEGSEEEKDGQTQKSSPTLQPTPTAAPTAAPTLRPVPTVAPQPSSEREQEPEPEDNSGAPVLTLKVSEVKVNAGQGPAWVDIIGTLSDDADDYNTLFQNLNVADMTEINRVPIRSVFTRRTLMEISRSQSRLR